MKLCKCCGQTKPLSEMTKDNRLADGRGSTCKPCRSVLQKAQRKSVEPSEDQKLAKKPAHIVASNKLTTTQRYAIGAGVYVKREREPNEATGVQINKMAGVYSQADSTFFRNDGHKHLKSRGVLC